MNFHILSRKELQALCKKNKIPANITNVAMADALSALPQVEGLDEILNPTEGDAGTPVIQQRTACRTSAVRKAVKEPESSKVSTRPSRGTRAEVAEGVVEQENKDANVSATPAMVPSSRRRVPAVSTRRKKEVIMVEDGDDDKNAVQGKVPKTPAVAPSSRTRATGRSVCNKKETPSGTSVQKGYSTRRSVRLLGKSLSEMSLVETEDMGLSKIDDVSEELSSVSQNIEDSSNTEKWASLQTVSTVLSDNTDDLEVSSLNKADCECQSHDLSSEVKLISVTENDTGDELQAEPLEEGSEKVNQGEAEPHDSSLNLQGSIDACDDSNEAGSELLPELEESSVSAKQDAFSVEVSEEASMVIADDSNDAASEQPELVEYDGTKQDTLFIVSVEASMKFADQAVSSLSEDASSVEESEEASMDIAAIAPVVLPDEASMDGPDHDVAEHLNVADGYHIQNFEPMHDGVDEQAADKKDVSPTEAVLVMGSFSSGEHQQVEEFEPKQELSEESSAEIATTEYVSDLVEQDVAEHLNVADGNHIQNFEAMHDGVDEQAADKNDVSNTEAVLEMGSFTSEEHREEVDLEPKLELSVSAEIEKTEHISDLTGASSAILAVKDATYANSGAENEVCIEVEDVTQQLSLLGVVAVHEAEEQRDASEKLEAEAQAEESEERTAGEDTKVDAANAFSVEDGMSNPNMMKENLTNADDFHNMSLRGIKKKLKELNGKLSSKTNRDAGQMQEVEGKRTALKALTQNLLTTGGSSA